MGIFKDICTGLYMIGETFINGDPWDDPEYYDEEEEEKRRLEDDDSDDDDDDDDDEGYIMVRLRR